eukprot:scaffold30_cov416-Prasinococcus_capsulatus_cf.AAC.14
MQVPHSSMASAQAPMICLATCAIGPPALSAALAVGNDSQTAGPSAAILRSSAASWRKSRAEQPVAIAKEGSDKGSIAEKPYPCPPCISYGRVLEPLGNGVANDRVAVGIVEEGLHQVNVRGGMQLLKARIVHVNGDVLVEPLTVADATALPAVRPTSLGLVDVALAVAAGCGEAKLRFTTERTNRRDAGRLVLGLLGGTSVLHSCARQAFALCPSIISGQTTRHLAQGPSQVSCEGPPSNVGRLRTCEWGGGARGFLRVQRDHG